MSFIKGTLRSDVLLFPEAIDDYITSDNPVRFIEAFVDNLDLHSSAFLALLLLTQAVLLTRLLICSSSISMATSIALRSSRYLSENLTAISNSSG